MKTPTWIVIALAAAIACSAPARGADRSLVIYEADIRQLLSFAAQSAGVRCIASAGVKGTVTRRELPASTPELIAALQGEFGLEWYRDGDAYYVSSRREAVTRLIDLKGTRIGELESEMKALNLDNVGFALRSAPGSDSVYFSGPATLAARVEALVHNLNQARARSESDVVTVVRAGHVSFASPGSKGRK